MCFCFPEVTSLAKELAKTPDSKAAITRPVAELLLCLPHLYDKLAHCTRYNVDNVPLSPPSTQGHKKHCEQQREPDDEHKINLTA